MCNGVGVIAGSGVTVLVSSACGVAFGLTVGAKSEEESLDLLAANTAACKVLTASCLKNAGEW